MPIQRWYYTGAGMEKVGGYMRGDWCADRDVAALEAENADLRAKLAALEAQ